MSAANYLFEIKDIVMKKKILSMIEQKLVTLRGERGVSIPSAVDHRVIRDTVIVIDMSRSLKGKEIVRVQ
jgi:hypothetical protein